MRKAIPTMSSAATAEAAPAAATAVVSSPESHSPASAPASSPAPAHREEESQPPRTHIRALPGYRWDEMPVLRYKEDGGTHFKSITRQVLCPGHGQAGELRYFEMEPDGHSTMEIHQHVHSVIILRGKGQCLVGETVYDLAQHDIVYIPGGTWHQFRANKGDYLGFLCMVDHDRDRPTRPSEAVAARLRENPEVAAFIRL